MFDLSRLTLFALILLISGLVVVSRADASAISYSGSTLTYTAAPGESNSAIVTVNPYDLLCDPVPAPCLSIFDYGIPISFPSSLCAGTLGDVRCAMPSSIVANLGDREDSFYDWDGDSTINAGSGDDNPIQAGGGGDTLAGDSGSDLLIGGTGDDLLDGGAGDDYLEGVEFGVEADTQGRDTYRGGGGSDRLNFDGRGDDLTLSPDGIANDGAAGEGDDIGADIMVIVGGRGADTMTGNSTRNVFGGGPGDDRVVGAGGDDQLSGGNGNDSVSGDDGQDVLGGDDGDDLISGGSGVDQFWGDDIGGCIPSLCTGGQDQIRARDGSLEQIDCGPGTDSVEIDAIDRLVDLPGNSDQCESVDGAGGAAGGSTGSRARRTNAISVRMKAPGAGRVTVRATARTQRKTIKVGRASRAVRRAGPIKVLVKMSAESRRALQARGKLKVLLRITFRPRGGGPSATARRVLTLLPTSAPG